MMQSDVCVGPPSLVPLFRIRVVAYDKRAVSTLLPTRRHRGARPFEWDSFQVAFVHFNVLDTLSPQAKSETFSRRCLTRQCLLTRPERQCETPSTVAHYSSVAFHNRSTDRSLSSKTPPKHQIQSTFRPEIQPQPPTASLHPNQSKIDPLDSNRSTRLESTRSTRLESIHSTRLDSIHSTRFLSISLCVSSCRPSRPRSSSRL